MNASVSKCCFSSSASLRSFMSPSSFSAASELDSWCSWFFSESTFKLSLWVSSARWFKDRCFSAMSFARSEESTSRYRTARSSTLSCLSSAAAAAASTAFASGDSATSGDARAPIDSGTATPHPRSESDCVSFVSTTTVFAAAFTANVSANDPMGSTKPENHPPFSVPFDGGLVADVAETSVRELPSTPSAFFFPFSAPSARAPEADKLFSAPEPPSGAEGEENVNVFVFAVVSANAFSAASANVARNSSAALSSPASRYAVSAEAISPAAARARGAEMVTTPDALSKRESSMSISRARFARQAPIASPRRTPEGVVSSSSSPRRVSVSVARVADSRRAPFAPTRRSSRCSTRHSTKRAIVSSARNENEAVGFVLSVSAAVAAARARRASARIAKSAVHATATKMAPAMPTARSRVTSVGRGIS
mmetsp:Transcript_12591/g.52778  ORF Transcript_12591/g.52778 Transcript_12591/m.52778 type:complete len:424 (+) Transcript_12591:792-2063(+)